MILIGIVILTGGLRGGGHLILRNRRDGMRSGEEGLSKSKVVLCNQPNGGSEGLGLNWD